MTSSSSEGFNDDWCFEMANRRSKNRHPRLCATCKGIDFGLLGWVDMRGYHQKTFYTRRLFQEYSSLKESALSCEFCEFILRISTEEPWNWDDVKLTTGVDLRCRSEDNESQAGKGIYALEVSCFDSNKHKLRLGVFVDESEYSVPTSWARQGNPLFHHCVDC
jgi:hypothetical protein